MDTGQLLHHLDRVSREAHNLTAELIAEFEKSNAQRENRLQLEINQRVRALETQVTDLERRLNILEDACREAQQQVRGLVRQRLDNSVKLKNLISRKFPRV